MRPIELALLLVVPVLLSCASSGGLKTDRAPGPNVDSVLVITSDGSWRLIALDSARVDSLRQGGVFIAQHVDERPDIVSGPQLDYPVSARRECITGRVIVQAIVGRDGRAETSSVGVRRHLDRRLEAEALRYMRQAKFQPGKVHGEAVRTLVNVPVDFEIRGAPGCVRPYP